MSKFPPARTLFWSAPSALVILVTALTSLSATGQVSDKLLSEVRLAAEKRQLAGQTARIAWSHRETHLKGSISLRFPPPFTKAGDAQPPHDATNEGTGVIVLNGNQARISRTSMVWHLTLKQFHQDRTETVIKGKEYSSLNHYGSQEWPQGRLSKDGWRNDAEILIWPALMALRGDDDQVVREGGIKAYTAARRLVVNGRPSVEATRERTETQGERKILFDDRPGYPIRLLDTFQQDGSLATRIVVLANKALDGIEYPSEWKISSFLDRAQLDSVQVKVESFDLHPVFAGREFSLDFPVGTYVVDTQTESMREYIVREGGKHRLILPEERGAGYDALANSETGALAQPQVRSRTMLLYLVGGLLVLSAMVLAAIRWRWHRLPAP